MHSASVYV
ncbi:hypothetical protein ECEC1869_3036, partial [Escherichia coli EC1869]